MIPLCHVQSSFEVSALCFHFPEPAGIWFLTSFRDGQWYSLCFSVPPLLQPLHLFSPDHPTSHNLFCTHSPSTPSFLVTFRCFLCSRFVGLSSTHSLDWLQPHSFFQLLTHVLCCPSLPIDHLGLFRKYLLHVLWADYSHVHLHLLLKYHGVPLWLLDAQITGLTYDCSCRSSHLSPGLENLLPPRCLLSSIFPSTLHPRERSHGGKFLLNLKIIHRLVTRRTHSCLLLPSASSTSAFL